MREKYEENQERNQEECQREQVEGYQDKDQENCQKEGQEKHHKGHCGKDHHNGRCDGDRIHMRQRKACANQEYTKEDNLFALIDRCNHFLHHKRGPRRGQIKLLSILAEHGEMNQKELQEILGIESGSISEIAIKMERKGLLSRINDESDKRMIKLRITEEGREKIKENKARSEEKSLAFNALSEEEQDQLKELLQKLLKSWEESNKDAPMGRRCGGKRKEHRGRKSGHHFHNK